MVDFNDLFDSEVNEFQQKAKVSDSCARLNLFSRVRSTRQDLVGSGPSPISPSTAL